MNNKFWIKVDENNLFYKIRRFIKNLFYKGNNTRSPNDTIENKKYDNLSTEDKYSKDERE